MPRRQYSPTSRYPQYQPDGKMSKNRLAWLRTAAGQFVIMKDEVILEDKEQQKAVNKEIGPTLRLLIPTFSGRPFTFDFTAMTMEEFDLTKEFFNLLFNLAEPVIRERDKVANDAFQRGDDSFSRSYRQPGQLVIRERTIGPNGQSLWDRSEDFPKGNATDDDSTGGLRRSGDALAAGESQDSSTEDDESKTD